MRRAFVKFGWACAAECVPEAVRFFNVLQHVFTFFGASTGRWELLSNSLNPGEKVLKRADGTRWSTRFIACDSSLGSWRGILKALSVLKK